MSVYLRLKRTVGYTSMIAKMKLLLANVLTIIIPFGIMITDRKERK